MLYISKVYNRVITVEDTESSYLREFTDVDFFYEFSTYGDLNTSTYNIKDDIFGAVFRVQHEGVLAIPQTKDDILRSEDIRKKIKLDKVNRKMLNKYTSFSARVVTNDIVNLKCLGCIPYNFKIPNYVTCLGSFFLVADGDNYFDSDDLIFDNNELVIPSSVKYVSEYAFGGLGCLRSIRFTGNLKYLGSDLFNSCFAENFESMYLPDDIDFIEPDSFRIKSNKSICGNSKFANIVVPRKLWKKHKGIFKSCDDRRFKFSVVGV